MNQDRIIRMIVAAQESTGIVPDHETKWRWLTTAWQEIVARVEWHQKEGRTKQANAWRDAAMFFQLRYDGEFTP